MSRRIARLVVVAVVSMLVLVSSVEQRPATGLQLYGRYGRVSVSCRWVLRVKR